MSDFAYTPDAEDEGQGTFSANLPSYMIAAANHSTGNQNQQWYQDNPDASLGQRAYNFIGSSVASAINGFRNTGIAVGNMFSEEQTEYVKTEDMIAGFDEDMSQYYQANRQSADLVGFVASSFIPGMAGVKVFNAGAHALTAAKGGVFGLNMSKGLGILPGARQTLVAEAAQAYATSRTAFSLTNANTVKAVAAGFGENVLQSAAFEVAVAATMFKSPILEDMDVGDLVGNIVTGALVGGVIGGTIDAARSVFAIKKGIKEVDAKLIPATQMSRGAEGTSASDSILITRNDLDTFRRNAPEGVDPVLYGNLVEDKLRAGETEIRAQWGKLAKGDEQVANLLDVATRNDPSQVLAQKVLNLATVENVADASARVSAATKAAMKTGGPDAVGSLQLKYMHTFGDRLGQISDDIPTHYSIADHLPKGQKVEISANGVKYGTKQVDVDFNKVHDALRGTSAENEARHMWAIDPQAPSLSSIMEREIARAKRGVQVKSLVDGKYLRIGANDVAMLGKAYREGFAGQIAIVKEGRSLKDPVTEAVTKGADQVIARGMEPQKLLEYIAQRKDQMASKLGAESLVKGNPDAVLPAIAKRLDVTEDWLTGAAVKPKLEDSIFGMLGNREKWYQRVHANNPNPPDINTLTPWKERQMVGMVYDTARMEGIDTFQMEAMAIVKARQKLQETTNQVAAARTLGDNHALLPEWNNNLLGGADRTGAGPSFISFANGNYGSLASFAEYVGSLVTKWTQGNTQRIADTFASVNNRVVNSPEAATELATIFSKIRAAGSQKYVIDGDQIVLKSYRDHERRLAGMVDEGFDDVVDELPQYIAPQGVDVFLPVNSRDVMEWLKTHVNVNAKRVEDSKIRQGARGLDNNLDAEAIYPPLPSPERFTHHAFVVDESIRDTGHVSMLYGADAAALEKQINVARQQGFTVLTKGDTAAYYRARGEYDYSQGFNENYIDATLARSGASAAHFPVTGTPSEMVQDWMQWHISQENMAVRDAVKLQYSRQLGTLNKQSEAYESIQQSTRTGFFDRFKTQIKNPYQDYVKTMMGVSRQSEYPVWKSLNDTIDRAGSKVWGAISDIFSTKSDVYDTAAVNNIMQQYGLKVAATDAQLQAWVNHPAGQTAVTKFIGNQNALLSALTLRLDPVNALNNAVGSTILTGAEVASVQRAIRSGNSDAVGALSRLMDIQLPGVDDVVRSPAKLIAGAYADILGQGGKALIEKYKGLNVVVDQVQQFRNLLETVTIEGTETAAQLDSKMAKAMAMMKTFADKGEKWTGNKFAEQMNRAVSARIMDKITDVAVQAGVMDAKTANTYINTFVNRTQANVIASQRPQMFQGPLGQAIGLFQSYQFNIMQQLLRHVGEGSGKDALTLLGMQGTVYGASGLPAFQAINTHIIGNASGNKEHTDAYAAINGVLGKSVGDWFTYGLASNIMIHPDLKINLYSRGDISPRSLTIVPTNLADMPIAGAWTRAFQSAKGTLSNVANGGDVWNSILSGVEQQGISRPMKGLAQVLRGLGEGNMSYSASGAGNVIAANDFLSLANIARLSGAKPFDEAVTQDALFRIQAYQSKDKGQRDALGKAIRTVVGNGGTPTSDQMENFMDSYAKIGGTQTEFSKWYMQQLKTATTPQANKIVGSVGSSYAHYMQVIMGGRSYNTPTVRPTLPVESTPE